MQLRTGPRKDNELSSAVEHLVEALRPDWVYVFGSQARGDATARSDIDLLVVVPRSDLPPHRRDQAAYSLVGRHLTPLDILVMTRTEFQQRCVVVTSLPATVLREGCLIYAA